VSNLFVDTDDIARAVEAIANPLEHLVGEGKKFKTTEDLAKGKLYSDLYAPKLEMENRALKEQLAHEQAELETLRSRAMETVNMVNEVNTNSSTEVPNPAQIKPEDIAKTVKDLLASEKDTERRINNVNLVMKELQSNLGDNYASHMAALADEYGKEYLMNLAEENPKVFLKLAQPTSTPTQPEPRKATNLFSLPPANSVNTTSKAQGAEVKAHKYYQNMRRTNPKYFNSPQGYTERLEQLTKLGDRYFDL
jgi:hypothetical protein